MNRWLLPTTATTAGGLILESAPAPTVGPEEVLVSVGALSINARDRMILGGQFGRLPATDLVPLSDLAGTIEAVGDDVVEWNVGDRVMTAHVPSWENGTAVIFGVGAGSFADQGVAAEFIVVPASQLIRTPSSLDDAEAATLQVAGVTAWNALFGARPVQSGEGVLIIGSGGVSLYAAQLAKAAGARLFAATNAEQTDPRWAELEFAGAVDTGAPGWGAQISELSGGGVAKVVNILGPGAVPECLDALAPGGEVATPGLMDMRTPEINILDMIGKQTSVRGVAVGSVQMHRDLADFMTEHDLHPIIGHTVPFTELPMAYEAISAPGIFGKVVITVP